MHRGDAGANLNFFKFEIGNTGFIRRNWVTWCPDVVHPSATKDGWTTRNPTQNKKLKSTTDCNERKPENLIECQPDIEKKGDTTILTALLNIPETYPNMPQQKYDSYGIRLPSPQIAFRDLVQQLTTGPALRCFLRKGYKVYI
jgi:hypothetical protein